MNILQITLGFLPADAWGGPVKIVHANSKELIRRGHHVTVYCTNLLDKHHKLSRATFEREIDGIRVVYFNTWHLRFWPGTLGPIWLPEMPDYLRKEIQAFDVVHLNGYRNLMDLPVIKAARQHRKPVVMQPHGTMPVIINSLFIKKLYDGLLGRIELEGSKAFIALQESEKQQIMAYGIQPERVHVIANGLDSGQKDTQNKGTFRKLYDIPVDKPLILFLGRINRKKGTDMLVEAFSLLENKNIYLAIAGPDDGQLSEVQELIRKKCLSDRVILPGLLSGTEVLEAYADADLFVLPCRTDTFPTTIMEACRAETPMVVTDTCEIAHLIKDRVAEVVPFNDVAFADAMQRVLTDTNLYSKYKANCAEVLQDTFSIQVTIDRLAKLYRSVIEENKCIPH